MTVALAGLVACALSFVACWWHRPAVTLVAGGSCLVAVSALGTEATFLPVVVLCAALGVVAGLGFTGRAAWLAAAGYGVLLALLYAVSGEQGVGMAMLTLPGLLAGTALRLRRETAAELALRARELEEEREQFARLAVRNERARIAAELHDIVGHSLSVMVVQAQAGQRLADADPEGAARALRAIAESASQGQEDLGRLVALLEGEAVAGPDLTLIAEVADRAARSGLKVTCRFEGDHEATPPATAQLAFRVVQEALTNALRYAPGSEVHIQVSSGEAGLTVGVTNDRPRHPTAGITGSGQGLAGLRERVQEIGGSLASGHSPGGGWSVEAVLPTV